MPYKEEATFRTLKKSMLFMILGFMIFELFPIPIGLGQGTQLKVVAPATNISVPTKFNVNITVVDVPAEPNALFSWQIMLYYNTTVLRWVDATLPPGHVFDGKTYFTAGPVNSSDPGALDTAYILFTASLAGFEPRFTGSGILCQIQFEAQAAGTSPLTFSKPLGGDTYLISGPPDFPDIPGELIDGSVNVVGVDTRLPSAISINIDPPSAIAGVKFTINGAINATVGNGTSVYIEYLVREPLKIWLPLATVTTISSRYSYTWVSSSEEVGLRDIHARWGGDIAYKPATSEAKTVVVRPDDIPPTTLHDYDGLWHTTDFAINLVATDVGLGVAETYYKINNGTDKNKTAHGQPLISTENEDNKLEFWSVDEEGNEEFPHKVLQGIRLDKTAPTGSIKINNDANYTTSTSVTLTLIGNDSTSGIYDVRFSNDGMWDTETWEPPSTTKAWDLSLGDGTKTVYYQIKDNAGLISQSYFDTIKLDMTPPTISIISLTNGSEIRLSTITATWTGLDETSGISYYEIRLDNGSWINVETNTTYAFTGLSDGGHTIDVRATDKAGISNQSSVSFTVNTSPLFGPGYSEEIAILVTTILLLVLAIALYFLKVRKR